MQFLYRKVSAVIGEHSFKVHIVEAFHVVFTNVLKAPADQGRQLKNIFLKKFDARKASKKFLKWPISDCFFKWHRS